MTVKKTNLTWADVFVRLHTMHLHIERTQDPDADCVFGVPRGGAIVAGLLALKYGYRVVDSHHEADIIVDDIIDSGRTRTRLLAQAAEADHGVAPLFVGMVDKLTDVDRDIGWVVFPWEGRDETADVEDSVTRLLEFIGEDPTRDGLKDTPKRFVKALGEMTSGLAMNPADPLARVFDEDHDEIVCVRDVPFSSLCEHHLLGFTGVVHFAYIPKGKIVGLSKIPRMIEILAKRPQVQERFATQIVDTFDKALKPRGVMAVVEGKHSCMSCRGVRSSGSMVTSVVRGFFKELPEARAEALALMGLR